MASSDLFDRVAEAAAVVRARIPAFPEVAVVLGSGLGGFAERLTGGVTIPYAEIPHWPPVSVAGHDGRLVVGAAGGTRVALLAGRTHLYEGAQPEEVTFGVRVLATAGVKTLILTNAAGGINASYPQGALMVIDDHLNLTGANPLVGPHDERFGARFPDMTEAWSRRLRRLATAAGRDIGLLLTRGVYAAVLGPSYETPAEIRALRTLGADAVGMSTVPELLVARQMGLEVLGLSCITNAAAGVRAQPLSHDEVVASAGRTADRFARLLERILARLGDETEPAAAEP
ncbi:MAG: purine-nucleoside phosphorylase [Acidobacteriota bacterium]|nr:purine-nucleoside phosphorylase [Acidobacteriota bacterium]